MAPEDFALLALLAGLGLITVLMFCFLRKRAASVGGLFRFKTKCEMSPIGTFETSTEVHSTAAFGGIRTLSRHRRMTESEKRT
jgi:hypothetical protein